MGQSRKYGFHWLISTGELLDDRYNSFELPGAKPHYSPDRPGQIEHIALDLTLDIPNQSYQGTCTIRLNPVRSGITSLSLDAVQQTIYSVAIGDHPQPFDYDGEHLHIQLIEPTTARTPITLTIVYRVDQPQRGLYFVAPNQHYPHKSVQVWTQGEDEDSRFWFPCFDYPGQLATSEIRVTVPKTMVAISNGELVSTEEQDDTKIYHWVQQQVHPSYLMTLAVGDFAELRDEWRGKPVTYYVVKGREADARRSMGKTPRMMEFFSQTFGYPYAYPKYAQVCVEDFIFGGMENTSTTLLTDRCLLDERASLDDQRTESLVAHELAHQWFGDLVVIKHWSHAWLKEGMASYAEVLWTAHEYGPDEAAYYLLQEAWNYLAEDRERYRRPIVTHVYREAIELYDRHLYEKGACVYHMIRRELGDDLFWQAIHTFVNDNAHKTVETVDLLRAIEKATGRNLLFLFDQYVFRGGHPDYKVAYSWDADNKLAKLTITQTQAKDNDSKDLFDLKIPIAIGYLQPAPDAASTTPAQPPTLQSLTLHVHDREQSFYIPLEKKPDFISFDHGNHTLKTLMLDYPLPELKAQLQHDPDPIARIHAAEALAKKGGLDAVKALAAAFQAETLWCVRVEIVRNVATIKLDQAMEVVMMGLQDAHARVRRMAVDALAGIKTIASYTAVKTLAEVGDPSYYVEAAALRAVGTIAATITSQEESAIALLKTALENRSGWNEVVRAGAIGGLSQLKTSAAALDVILDYTELGVPQPLRLAAIRALGAISSGQAAPDVTRILDRLQLLARETFFLTQVAVCSALGQMETTRAIGILHSLADQTPDGRVRRLAEEAIQSVQRYAGSDKAVKQLREELDELKQANQDLRSRLAALEAKTTATSSQS